MKAIDSHSHQRRCLRRRRSFSPSITFYCSAAVTFFVCNGRIDNGGMIPCLPGVKSFQYDDRNSLVMIRCGGLESDENNEIDGQPSCQLVSLQIDTLTQQDAPLLSLDRPNFSPRQGLWKRIRVIRGGVDETKEDDDKVEGDDGENDATNSLKNETFTSSKDQDLTAPAGDAPEEDDIFSSNHLSSPDQGKEGGVFSSFFSLFRAPAESEDSNMSPTNTSNIAHKIPHGPDGRGGGSAVFATLPPPEPATKDSEEHDTEEEEFVITTEVTKVSTDATTTSEVKLAKSQSTVPEVETKPPLRKGGESTAFVVPPPHKPLPSVDTRGEDTTKSKSSKVTKGGMEAVHGNKTMKTLNSTLNATDVSAASNETLSNATKLPSTFNESDTDQTRENLEMRKLEDYTSSGYWVGIDLVASFGLSSLSDDLKLSRALRPIRKAAAKATGLHGFVSGKEYTTNQPSSESAFVAKTSTVISIDEELGIHDANALEAEMLARRVARRRRQRGRDGKARGNNNRPGRRWGFRRGQQAPTNVVSDYVVVPSLDSSPDALEHRRRTRVQEIDRLLHRGSERLLELQCERDDLLRAPNPLFNYTKKEYDPSTNQTFGDVRTTREFNFPPSELVNEYIGELVSSGRLIRLNHTELWQSRSDDGIDDDEIVGDDLLTPSADARKLYENLDELEQGTNNRNGKRNKSGGGSWLLRTGFGRNGGSLGEKLGETIEIGAYKGVCSAVMMVLARALSGLHGINILSHSDIRTYIEQDPDLPPINKRHGPLYGDNVREKNYAQEAIKTALQKGAKKKRKTSKHGSTHRSSSRRHGHELSDDAFIQRDAVVETLISHCQISAPLLKLFPLDWQRAMVGNIITLATAIISDFADGLQVQILGHALTASFKPITEADMIQHIGVGGFRQNHRRTRPDEFEAAVLATALDISESLSFLDGWLEWVERRVGGGVLRSQIGNLIARVVLTLVDEVLSGARLDLWSSQANGPRLYAALEYRTSSKEEP